MHFPSLIGKKRDGGELSSEEIAQVISGFTRGEIPDYQMSALAPAIFFRGMSDMETWDLTKTMRQHVEDKIDFAAGISRAKCRIPRRAASTGL